MDIEKILKELTIEDKIRLLGGDGDWHTYDCGGKIPKIMMTDGPHGLRKVVAEKRGDVEGSLKATCFPTASALAASWDPEVTGKVAKAIASEAKAEGVSIVLGCGTNIKRSPFCGRNFEYFSEDPFLAGELASSYISSMQKEGVGTSLKHFAVNSQETRRMTSNSEVDERALREIYLAAFEKVVKNSNPTTVMCSYNRINGEYASHNKYLLTDILRNEWGYDGAVISDWGATNNVVSCFKSGLNLEMPDPRGFHTKELKKAYDKGDISEEEINAWAGVVLKRLVALSEKRTDAKKPSMEAQHSLAAQLESECAVLLKNNGSLPVDKDKKLIVAGELAEHMRFQGGGSSHINAYKIDNAIDALKDEGYDVVYTQGYKNETDIPDSNLVEAALRTVKENYKAGKTKILFFVGLTDIYEGEGYDREDLAVPYNQIDLLERIAGICEVSDLVAISFGGAPMDMSWDENVSAVLHMYLGGQGVGSAVAALVSGRVNPSGKLAETFPLSRTDTPAWRYFANPYDDVEYRESIFAGYRYYETYNVPVKYPFGYGLSYTSFEYSNLTAPECFEGKDITVSVTVKNTGKVAGAEVVEFYVLPEKENFLRSAIELKGFKKVFLEAGEEKRISITLNDRSFSVYDVDKSAFSVIGGVYTIAAGSSVKDLRLKANIVVNGNRYFRNEKELFPDYFKPQPHGMDISREQFETLYGKPLTNFKERKRGDYDINCSFYDVTRKSFIGLLFRAAIGVGLKFMFPGKGKNDPAFKMLKSGVEEGNLEGLIANSGGLISIKLVNMLVLCANKKPGKAFAQLFKRG